MRRAAGAVLPSPGSRRTSARWQPAWWYGDSHPLGTPLRHDIFRLALAMDRAGSCGCPAGPSYSCGFTTGPGEVYCARAIPRVHEYHEPVDEGVFPLRTRGRSSWSVAVFAVVYDRMWKRLPLDRRPSPVSPFLCRLPWPRARCAPGSGNSDRREP